MARKSSTAADGASKSTAVQQDNPTAGLPGSAPAPTTPLESSPVLAPPTLDGAAPMPVSSSEQPSVSGAALHTVSLSEGPLRVPEGPGVIGGADDTAPGAALQQVASADRQEPEEIEALFIRAVPEQGWRRCGQRFTREGHGIALSLLSEADIDALCNDPNLVVEHCTVPAEEQH